MSHLLFKLRLVLILILFLSLSSCYNIRDIYNQDIKQGYFISDDVVARIKIGMNKNKISELLGKPTFLPISNMDSWCYYYYYIPSNNDIQIKRRSLLLYFDNDILTSFLVNH